jgi:hypothetical protein
MSIANLFSPNDYNLFVNTITPRVQPGSIETNDIDTINTNDTLTIGTVKAGPIVISRPGQSVTITDGSQLEVQVLDHATSANLYPSTPFITMGASGGVMQFNGGIGFAQSGPPMMNFFSDFRSFLVGGTGPFASQTIGWYSLQRINTIVTAVIKWTVGTIPVTVNNPLTILPQVPSEFIPLSVQAYSCQVRTVPVPELGTVSILTNGTIVVFPTATSQWLIGQFCDFDTICFSYEIGI